MKWRGNNIYKLREWLLPAFHSTLTPCNLLCFPASTETKAHLCFPWGLQGADCFSEHKDLLHLASGGCQCCYEATPIFRKEHLYISVGSPCFITATEPWDCASDHSQANLPFVLHKNQVSHKPQFSLETYPGTVASYKARKAENSFTQSEQNKQKPLLWKPSAISLRASVTCAPLNCMWLC